ncbi:HAD family hydrolase [Paenibacillus sp. YPG26]|uniref:HAD family hydrolase n=1 Tax=Paenibacillus sp. YPG26 TaxID=2878915 RepID=UPI002042464D|nr:HAD family hydrolase [Paenibacillus sp. YPG26]USB33381.1 HAD family hydrolase [Paenibacillus sp. YPG26]
MIKAVVFDLDGTLLDRDTSLKQFVLNQHDRIEALHSVDKVEYAARFIELDSKGYIWKDKVYFSLINEYRISGVSADDLLADYIKNFRYHCTPFPNLKQLLDFITSKEVRIAMITNGFGDFQLGNVDALGISDYFEFIMVSELEGIRKPDEEIFRRALSRLGIKASEAIYVGDHPDNDVKASMRAGMKGIWKSDSYYKDDFNRDGVIYDLLDLKSLL